MAAIIHGHWRTLCSQRAARHGHRLPEPAQRRRPGLRRHTLLPRFPQQAGAGPFPSPVLQQQPTTGGARYSGIQFETDAPASEVNTCVPQNPQGCAIPPPGGPGHFYPFCTLAKVGGQCVWELGNMSNGNSFGGDQQYAHLVEHGFFKGQFDLASALLPNPTTC